MSLIPLIFPYLEIKATFEKPSIEKMAGFVHNYISENKLKSYVLIGHSMSRKIALFTAFLDKNKLIDQLVLVAPSPPRKKRS
ncbi:hypothetical protein [Zunongwangia sp.]|uniref:hypothetical protein n=1 Tax=Zunongwangia sp. TaxID=1965325 RepID=UPI003AA8A3EE